MYIFFWFLSICVLMPRGGKKGEFLLLFFKAADGMVVFTVIKDTLSDANQSEEHTAIS